MDKAKGAAYGSGMLVRLTSLLAILVLTLMGTVVPAHLARLQDNPHHAAHTGQAAAADTIQPCADSHPCTADDQDTCKVLCGGLMAFLTVAPAEPERSDVWVMQDQPAEQIVARQATALQERPPKIRPI